MNCQAARDALRKGNSDKAKRELKLSLQYHPGCIIGFLHPDEFAGPGQRSQLAARGAQRLIQSRCTHLLAERVDARRQLDNAGG
jgi:hypothetical protein